MQYSSRLPIAVHILIAIVKYEGEAKITSNFLANSVNVNPVVIRNILGQLKSAGLVSVEKGVGGAKLLKKPSEVTLYDIFCAVEKNEDLFNFHKNPNPDCPVGKNLQPVLENNLSTVQKAMFEEMKCVSLELLIEQIKQRENTDENDI